MVIKPKHVGAILVYISLLLLGAELPLMFESFDLLNNIFLFPLILDAGYPVFNFHLSNILFYQNNYNCLLSLDSHLQTWNQLVERLQHMHLQ